MSCRRFAPANQLDMFDVGQVLCQKENAQVLPEVVQQLNALIGLDATIALVKEEGGNELRLPSVVDGSSPMWARLVEIVGHNAAELLVRCWPDTRLYVPMCSPALRAQRNRDIVQRYDAGESFESIRRSYKISRSYLFRLLKRPV